MKSVKTLLALLLALCMTLGLCACGEDSGKETETSGTEQSSSPSTDGSEETEESKKEPTYTVTVVDEGKNPVAGAVVQLCQGDNCNPVPTNADGVAEYYLAEGDYKVSFVVIPAGYELSGDETEFHFADGENTLTITLKAVS